MKIVLISCLNFNRAIGHKNKLLNNLKNEMKYFKNTTLHLKDKTKQNAVIMGRKTFISLGSTPLKNRKNIVITNKNEYFLKKHKNNKSITLFNEIGKSIDYFNKQGNIETLYVIGGKCIYDYFIDNGILDELILSEIKHPVNNFGDTFFPRIDGQYKLIETTKKKENNVLCNVSNSYFPYVEYEINRYKNTNKKTFILNTCENTYLNALKQVLYTGNIRNTRNSNTISTFGLRMEFNNIHDHFPLLTTKKMYWKAIKEELLWFIKGDTNSKKLEKKGVNIWKGNSTRKYLDNNNLHTYKEGECGPIYGFQWRNFNGDFMNIHKRTGIDQLQKCIDLIKTDPYSRRIFMSAWNPGQLNDMVLPPCHVSYQFYVTNENTLYCQMYQRSGDLFLGVPFNIASTALLTSMIANITGYKAGKIVVVIGDAHIYENHIEQIQEQLIREPYGFPKLHINKTQMNINDFKSEHFELVSYHSHTGIKADMVA